ncbi:uncharacterized protein [Choristoneura fumiferana]|uniref:uncharacterized protein n=1 Tax=Choristoneura fumiferana TaxID=7141 RepID=UPI003D1578C2
MSRVIISLVFAACVIAAGQASPATQLNCDDEVTQCTVSNVDITPCADKSNCQIKKGRNATINFDFTPEFSATELETAVSYLGAPFQGLERNACLFTTCPVTQGTTQALSYNLYLNKKLPAGFYTIKWKVWNKADPAQLCCFQTKIAIRKYVEMWARVLCLCVCVSSVVSETVTKKFCNGVDLSQCTIHNAAVDPCPKGINFCSLKRNKPYTLTVDFTPRFSAQKLKLAMYGDDNNDGTYDKVVKTPGDPCDLLSCPVYGGIPRIFNMHFTLDKTLGDAKFPVQFKLWNADDESQVCCFTFNVKVKK